MIKYFLLAVLLASPISFASEPPVFNDVRELELADEELADEELTCLALVVYHESRNQPIIGQMATASVVLNRAKSSGFPDKICAVVRQGGDTPPCQFSWYCDGKPDTPYELDAWRSARSIAEFVLDRREVDLLDGADHFHDTSIPSPSWARSMRRVVRIGDTHYYASSKE